MHEGCRGSGQYAPGRRCRVGFPKVRPIMRSMRLLALAVTVVTLSCSGSINGSDAGGGGGTSVTSGGSTAGGAAAGGSTGGGATSGGSSSTAGGASAGGSAGGTIVLVPGAPALMFTDLVSGPATGNSDDSQQGQTAGTDGAIVTVWGKHLGTTRGTVRVGGQVARIYAWGNATAPANLFVRHQMQMISFQVPASVPMGATTIQVEAGGTLTNTLPFTVRPGTVRYVKTTGNDATATGTWQSPYAKVSTAVQQTRPGDILYLCDGVTQTLAEGDRSTLDLDRNPAQLGTAMNPKALVAYPLATARVGTMDLNAWSLFVSGAPTPAPYWTISKLVLVGRHVAAAYSTGFRIIGNHISAPRGDDQTGAIGGDDSSDLFVLGNEVTNTGYAGTSKLYHPVYIQSRESSQPPRLPVSNNREIAWNYLHDNQSFDGINFYREGQYSAYMTNTRCHDNFIINQTGRGILIGTFLTGPDNYFYNNVIVRAGLGPPPAGPFMNDPAFGYVCVDINAGAIGNPPTTIHFYNNTLFGCGFGGGPSNTAGMLAIGNAYQWDLDLRNNVIVSTGFPFLLSYSTTARTTANSNLFAGDGGTPGANHAQAYMGRVTGDPRFVDTAGGDLRLQPGSAGIDQGSAAMPVPPVDFDNTPRPQGAGIDLGAFEAR